MEKLKRHTLNGSSLEWVLASDVEGLEAAKREDEARIAGLEAVVQEASRVAAANHKAYEAQLTAEQQAHAETKRQLEEAYRAIFEMTPLIEFEDNIKEAMRRQASINRPTDNSPTDDPNSYLEKCPQCGGVADNGHDRCLPPNPYLCSKCTDDRGEGEK